MNYLEYLINDVVIEYTGEGDSRIKKDRESEMAAAFEKVILAGYFRYGFGGLMAFNGRIYERLDDRSFGYMLKHTMENLGVSDLYRVNSTKGMMSHILDSLASPASKYCPKRNLISFDNGLLNLETMKFSAHSHEFETNIHLDHDYDPKAKCTRFRSYLMEVLPNSDAIRVLQEFVGAFFVDRRQYKIENILYLLGAGANGKSVFTDILVYALGTNNISAFELSALVNKPENISMVNGKLANICDDMSSTNVSGGNFKRFISGAPMPARFLFKDPFIATDLPLVIANVNEMPKTSDHTFGHHRRNIVIPFSVKIPKERMDIELGDKLKRESSGIINWIMEGRTRFLAQGGKFSESSLIAAENEKLRIESNNCLQFLRESAYYCEVENDEMYNTGFLSIKDMYEKYANWIIVGRHKNKFEKNSFSRIMAGEGFVSVRKAGKRGYLVSTKKEEYIKIEEGENDDMPEGVIDYDKDGLPF